MAGADDQLPGCFRAAIRRTSSYKTLIVIAIVLLTAKAGSAQRAIPEDNLAYPVLVTGNGQAASGFYINVEKGPTYFVTAKHVLFERMRRNYRLRRRRPGWSGAHFPRSSELRSAVRCEVRRCRRARPADPPSVASLPQTECSCSKVTPRGSHLLYFVTELKHKVLTKQSASI
jgi:hypothetical protein